jgi:hypothetical protein
MRIWILAAALLFTTGCTKEAPPHRQQSMTCSAAARILAACASNHGVHVRDVLVHVRGYARCVTDSVDSNALSHAADEADQKLTEFGWTAEIRERPQKEQPGFDLEAFKQE